MKTLIRLTAVAAFLLFGTAAHAVTISFDMTGNDCSGVYTVQGGSGGEDCWITAEDGTQISEVIGKADDDDEFVDPTFAGVFSWADVTHSAFGTKEGSWVYTGGSDIIRFWVVKNGSGFRVHYDHDNASCGVNPDSVACMSTANSVSSGTWTTASGLSHLTFYNGEGITVPEPGTIALLGLGLIGMGAARRRKVA